MASNKEASFIMRLVDMVTGPCKSITASAGAATDKLKSMAGQSGGLGAKLGSMFSGLKEKVGSFSKDIRAAADEVPGLNRVIELVTNPYVAVAAGVVALGVALGSATMKAMDFERGMAQVNTTAQLSKPELAQLTDKLLNMGANSTVGLEQIPGAFNQVISAVGDTQKSLEIFEPSLKAAQAGFTDIKTVTEAATNVMGSVGDALPTEVFDVLFATMRLGKAEFKDIANYLPKIIPAANNVGIKYQEIAASFALMTGKGQSAEQAAMLLQNAMTALGKSEVIYGTKSQAGFIRSGVAIFDHAGKMRKLVDIVGDLSTRTQGMTDKQRQAFLAGLGLDAQAASSFSVLAQNAKQLREFAGGVTNSTGEMNTAYENSLNTSDRLAISQNKFKKIMTEIGMKFLPLVNWGLTKVNSMMEWVNDNAAGIWTTIKVIAAVIAYAFLPEIAAAAGAVAAIYLGFRLVKIAVQAVFTIVEGFFKLLGWGVDWVYQKLGGDGSLIDKIFGVGGSVWSTITTLFGNFLKLLGAGLDMLDDISSGHFDKAKQRWQQYRDEVDGYKPNQYVKPLANTNWDAFGMSWALGGAAPGEEGKGTGKQPLTAALAKQNKGTDIQGDSKARIVNTRIDKIEVIVKLASTAEHNLNELGKKVAGIIVGSVRDSEIILSSGN